MTRKSIATSIIAIMLAFASFVGIAYAMPTATYKQFSNNTWSGTAPGIQSQFFVDNPALSAHELWYREVFMGNSDTSQYAGVGVEKCGTSNESSSCLPCWPWGNGTDELFAFYISRDANDATVVNHCYVIAQNDPNINTQVIFKAQKNSTNNGMVMTTIPTNQSGGLQQCNNFTTCNVIGNFDKTWAFINNTEYINATFTGEKVFGGLWHYNAWRSGNFDTWNYQTVDGVLRDSKPPQMYWAAGEAPSQGAAFGGELTSCVYASGFNNDVCKYRA